MSLTRRRLLTISAAFAACPGFAGAAPLHWQGRAFGAEVSITLHGPDQQTRAALEDAQAWISRIESRFSVYDPASEVSRLNARGAITPSAEMVSLLDIAQEAHALTGGHFDPTVQPLWQALALGEDTEAARAAIGWHRVQRSAQRISLAPGQALTLNGIAQGFATDRITEALTKRGFTQALINIGEHRALGGPWRVGLEDPSFGPMAIRTLTGSAIATSSPMATPLGNAGHILHKDRHPRWSTVSVEAETAALADALSTGLVLANLDQIHQIAKHPSVHRITLVDLKGDLTTVS